MSLTPAPQIQQAPRSGIIQKLRQQQQTEEVYAIDNSGDKQKTIKTSRNSEQQYSSSSESSPSITAELHSVYENENKSNDNSIKHNIFDNETSEYGDFFTDLTLEELEEAEEYCNDLFQHKIGYHLTHGTLHKLFLMVEPSYSALTEEEAEKFITKLFDNFKKEYTSEEKQYLQKRYPFRYKPYDNEEGAFYELHEVYKANPLILKEKYVLTRFTKKDSFEKKLVFSRIPYEVLQYTKEHFSKENPLYIPYIEREMNKINQCKYSNLFK